MRAIRLILLTLLLGFYQFAFAESSNIICYYDADGSEREGVAKFTAADMNVAIPYCSHVIYGYAGINAENFQLTSLNVQRDVQQRHFAAITALKDRFPTTKFLLSVGGDRDNADPEKYMRLLDADAQHQAAFIESARDVLRSYDFDGIDLAFQFPRNKPRKLHSDIGMTWKSIKKLFTGDYVVDPKADERKDSFTQLVKNLRTTFRPYDLMITLTVLPNVNASWYFNAPAIINYLDFVNLAAFDFTTPFTNPEEADYTAPLYPPPLEGNRQFHYNIDYQVDHWISQRIPNSKLNVGVTSYGRSWKLTKDSNQDGKPIVSGTNGPASGGPQTKTLGLLSWPEICKMLPNPSNLDAKGAMAPLQRIGQFTRKYGTYAYRPPIKENNNDDGIWVSYEDPDSVASKAAYVRNRNLGGIALFDLTMDDLHGQCTGEKFSILKAIKYRLL